MGSQCVLNKLRELGGIIDGVAEAERKWNAREARFKVNGERNVLQCPKESLSAMQNLQTEMKDLCEHSLSTHCKLRIVGRKSQKMLSTAERILNCLEDGSSKAEDYLSGFGYVPLRDCSKHEVAENSSVLEPPVSSTVMQLQPNGHEEKKYDGDVPLGTSLDAVPGAIVTDNSKPNSLFAALPKSPAAPLIDENFGSTSLHSPEDPLLKIQSASNGYAVKEEYSKIPNCRVLDRLPDSPSFSEATDLASASIAAGAKMARFFGTPGIDKVRENVWPPVPTNGIPYFKAIALSPNSPKYSDITLREPEPISPEFKLHSNQRALAEAPACSNGTAEEDNTVYMLGGMGAVPQMHSPEAPDLTDFYSAQKANPAGKKFQLPETPPSPDLAEFTKENIRPSREAILSTYEVRKDQYDCLPCYLKRIIPFDMVNDYLKKVLEASFALPGEKYTHVTTEQKISEVTPLGGKTKSFIFLLQSLKIVQRIRGTEFLDIII